MGQFVAIHTNFSTCLSIKDLTRRFRIKFSTTSSESSSASCKDFMSKMSLHFELREIPVTEGESQMPLEDSQVLMPSQHGSMTSDDSMGAGMTFSEAAGKVICIYHINKWSFDII